MNLGTLVSARTGLFFGWWVVFVSAFVVLLTAGTFYYGFGTLFGPLVKEFGWSHASISLAFSLRTEVGGVAAPVVGLLVDRVGPRRLMTGGVITVAVGFILLSRVQTLGAFYVAVLIIAVGMSASGGTVGYVAIAHWFRRHRGMAMGLLTVGGGVSGIMVVVLAALISITGWRDTLLILGLTQMVICVPLALSIRNRPEDLGLKPDGISESRQEPSLPSESDSAQASEGLTVREALRSPSFWRFGTSIALFNLGTTAIVVHQIPFFTSRIGLSEGAAAASVTAFTLMSIIGRFSGGYLADFVDKRFILAGTYTLTGISILLFASIYEIWQIFIVLPLFAVGFGGTIPVRAAFQAEHFGLRAYGAIQGLLLTMGTLGGVAGPVLVGWIFDQTESYHLAFALVSAGALLGAPLMLSIPKTVGQIRLPKDLIVD